MIPKGNSWDLSVTSAGNVQFEDPCNTAPPFISTNTIDNGSWHHVAGIYNGNELLLYLDGVLDNSRPATGSFADPGAPGDPVRIGVSLTGQIDDVFLVADALSLDHTRPTNAPACRVMSVCARLLPSSEPQAQARGRRTRRLRSGL